MGGRGMGGSSDPSRLCTVVDAWCTVLVFLFDVLPLMDADVLLVVWVEQGVPFVILRGNIPSLRQWPVDRGEGANIILESTTCEGGYRTWETKIN